jgi:hypothetical protein
VGAIGVVAVPEAMLVWVGVGVFIGALVWCGTQDCPVGDVPVTAATGRRGGLIAGVATIAGCLILTGLVTLLGLAGGVVIPMLFLVVAPVAWLWLRRGHRQPRRGTADNSAAGHHEVLLNVAQPPPVIADLLSAQELLLGPVPQLPRGARPPTGPGPLRDCAHWGVLARGAGMTGPRWVHSVAADRARRQRPRPLPRHRLVGVLGRPPRTSLTTSYDGAT